MENRHLRLETVKLVHSPNFQLERRCKLMESKRPKILLLGNGINLLFKDQSWEDMIKAELAKSGNHLTWEQIRSVPATMQIVLATNDKVRTQLKDIAGELEKQQFTDDRKLFLQRLIDLPMDCIMSANYSLELERANGFKGSSASYRTRLRRTFTPEDTRDGFRLYQYYPLSRADGNITPLWHIHGDIAKPNSMIMGHYYYEKHLREIQDRVARMMRSYHGSQSAKVDYTPQSWVDWFLMGDIYILGLGLYLCEADLWWLLCCKKRHFPESRVYYYGSLEDERSLLLEAYNGECMKGITPAKEDDYLGFYQLVMQDIQRRN